LACSASCLMTIYWAMGAARRNACHGDSRACAPPTA
jgi:hypothetical protein